MELTISQLNDVCKKFLKNCWEVMTQKYIHVFTLQNQFFFNFKGSHSSLQVLSNYNVYG